MGTDPARVLLYWLPLGAGGQVVRWNGRLYEAPAGVAPPANGRAPGWHAGLVVAARSAVLDRA